MPSDTRSPVSTYRLQITGDFDLFEAARRLQYLHDLGVDWVYLSPLLAAEPGSTHGYDVVAHDHIDASRGGEEGLAALSSEAKRLGMGVLVDIVPNHVGVATPVENPWWWDVLKLGRDSGHASAFDIDWAAGDGRIRIPVVGDDDQSPGGGPVAHLSVVEGELRYHDHRYPIAPGTAHDPGADVDGHRVDANTVHDRQHYELVNWRVADAGLNYRRFFAINTLAALRVEDPQVFADSHVEIKRWFDEGLVDGLRVDHPDGLRDPRGYLDDLSKLTAGAYVLVEKILALRDGCCATSSGTKPGEELLTSWATAGTTGYDALAHIDRVLTDPVGQAPLDAIETRLRGSEVDWAAMIHDTKREVADTILGSEVNRIVREILPLVEEGALTLVSKPGDGVADAVAELLACFPVYRSYLPEGRDHLDEAFALARRHRPDLAGTLDVLLPILSNPDADPAKRFQQTSGMVMAKGVEDCAFYRWSRLTSLNEVGGDPSVFALDPSGFHSLMRIRQADWPFAMTCLSTHDTKRSADVRARITVLAEIPAIWESSLDQLLSLAPMPDPAFGSLLWQAILGAWPASPDPDLRHRLHGYAEKAMREAGDRTTWIEPDRAYEAGVHAAVDSAFDSPGVRDVLDDLLARIASPGWSNSLAAKLLSITMPGVPDVYQGSELWEQSLVDPDNRRPVDFDSRVDLLDAIRSGHSTPLTSALGDSSAVKLRVTHAALTLRRERPDLFTSYAEVSAAGSAAQHLLAFDRGGAISMVTRLPVGLIAKGGWRDTTLDFPEGTWRNVISASSIDGGPAVPLAEILGDLPVALLVREDS